MEGRLPVTGALPIRLLAIALAVAVAGCAQSPTEPSSSLPDKVIRNIPSKRTATVPARAPVLQAPLHDEMPPIPIEYADTLDRIRAGMRMPDVDDPSVQVELEWLVRNGDYLNRVFARSQRYLYHIAIEVQAQGLPMELALLPVVESAYNPFAYSRSHAAGLWQFIPGTGKLFGLKQDFWQDQRRDVLESTRAALEYLTYLNNVFAGDWQLAIASYNYGSGNVRRAIARNEALGRDTDFFSLSLPAETRAYVPKLLALSRLVRNPGAYGITLPVVPDAPYFRVIETDGPVELRLAAGLAGVDVEELHALNPGWNQWVTGPDGPHRLLVPAVVADAFEPRFAALSGAERAGLTAYDVAAGDTVQAIASRHKVPVEFLQRVNDTDGARIAVGQTLLVPAGEVTPLRTGLVHSATARHVVRPGDSLWSISRRYGMSVNELARVNNLKVKGILRPGQRLSVRPATSAGGGTTTRVASGAETRQISYKVRKGDTLFAIARRFEVTVAQLQNWNSMLGSTALRAGQSLIIHVNARRDYGG